MHRLFVYFTVAESSAETKQLTDERLVKLPNRITERGKLRTLAIIGLGISNSTVKRHLQNSDITEAAFEMLDEWRDSQENEAAAFINICKALKHEEVGMEFLIGQAFE